MAGKPTPRWVSSRASRLLGRCLVVMALMLLGCQEPYRVGEYVWVEWDGKNYPAYVLEKKGKRRYRVHFEGYEARWDEDVDLERIKGRVEGPVSHPPPPEKVARAAGVLPKPTRDGGKKAGMMSPYKVGDRVKVKWRGSVYVATILEVEASDRVLVHYEGHESAWDESVHIERIVGRK